MTSGVFQTPKSSAGCFVSSESIEAVTLNFSSFNEMMKMHEHSTTVPLLQSCVLAGAIWPQPVRELVPGLLLGRREVSGKRDEHPELLCVF